MECMGFSAYVTKWFECYLSKRVFSVNVGNSFSDKDLINCGVPQGSILRALLFLLYVNDMVQTVNCDLLLYADETGLTFQHKGINIIEHQLNRNFSSICDWSVDNKLSIDDLIDDLIDISLTIKQYLEVIYLGCILDESLSGE